VCQDCSGSGSGSGSGGGGGGGLNDRSNHSAQRSDDYTINLSGENSGGEYDGPDLDAYQCGSPSQ